MGKQQRGMEKIGTHGFVIDFFIDPVFLLNRYLPHNCSN